jgi:hypothetical protein
MRYRTIGSTLALVQLALGLTTSRAEDPVVAKPIVVEAKAGGRTSYWLESSLRRVFPATPPGPAALEILAARNGRASFQACVRNDRVKPLDIECSVAGGDELKPRVLWVELVPVRHRTPSTDLAELDGAGHLPGMVADPLMPRTRAIVGSFECRSFWITLNIPADAVPGPQKLTVRQAPKDGTPPVELPVTVVVSALVIGPRQGFPVIHWWRGEATWDHYKTDMFDDRWWKLTEDQLANMLDHGSDVIYVPVFFDRREVFRRPCQLLAVDEPAPGVYRFDWSRVKRFTDMVRRIGFKEFEWSHLETIRQPVSCSCYVLTCVSRTHPVQPPVPVQSEGQLDQPQVVDVLLVVPHQDAPALRQPRQRPLHHPPPRLAAAGASLGPRAVTRGPDVPDVPARLHRRAPARVVEPGIQAQVLLEFLGVGPLDHDGLDGRLKQSAVRHVRPGDHHPERAAVAVDRQARLGA